MTNIPPTEVLKAIANPCDLKEMVMGIPKLGLPDGGIGVLRMP
jgi:hypothetical protein